MASPVVSGVAGLVISQFPSYTPAQIESQLKNTVDNIDALNPTFIGSLGTGRLNAYKALSTSPSPSLRYAFSSLNEFAGNGNGIVEPGETINIFPTVVNDWGDATNVTGVLSSTNPNVTILQPNGTFGNVTTALPGTAQFSFRTDLASNTPQVLSFNLALSADGGYTKNVTITVDLLKPIFAPQNWSFLSDAQNWTTSSGSLWHLTEPCYPVVPDKPAKYWLYGKTGCGNYDTSVANSGKLYSPAIAGTAGSNNNVVISFDQFIETENNPSYDRAYIKVKVYGTDDASATILGGPFSNSAAWQRKQFTIPQSIANSTVYQIFFDFNTVDSISNNFKGWYIDNINLTSTTANASDVLISEINWTGTPANNNDYFVELYNNTNNSIDLNNFVLKNIASSDFNIGLTSCSNTVLQPKNYFLIARYGRQDANTMLNTDPDCITGIDLAGTGKQITLVSHNNLQIDQTPTGNWAAGINSSCLTLSATQPCYSMSRDISKLDGTLVGSWYSSNQSLNMDSNFTYLNDAPVTRTTWVANTVGSGQKMTPKASNGFANPANQESYSFCASEMHFNRASRATDAGSTCNSVVAETNTDAEGKFSFPMEPSKNYVFFIEKEEHYTKREPFTTVGKSPAYEELTQKETTLNLSTKVVLNKIKKDEVFVVENINYDYDKWDIRPDAALELDKIVQFMVDNPTITIELSSHTDSRGDDKYNMNLSAKRAESSKAYMISKGIKKDRVISKGYGETKPLIPDAATEEDFQKNRRTEFKILKVAGMK